MSWSTRQLAELAGTTVKAVRHYHAVGLLDLPERASNGYKLYEVSHLVRLLQIKRLTELGVPLARVATMHHADVDPDAAIRELDAELESKIEHLQRTRDELAQLREHGAPLDSPPGFAALAAGLTSNERSLILIYSKIFDDTAMQAIRSIMESDGPDPEFDALPADADDATIDRIAERIAPQVRSAAAAFPWHADRSHSRFDETFTMTTVIKSIAALYNVAQQKVVVRASQINAQLDQADPTPDERQPQ